MARLAAAIWLLVSPATLVAQPVAVFTGCDGGTSDLYRLDLDSLRISRLTHSPANEREAAISPDGTQIVFVSDRDGAPALYLMSATASDSEIRLTSGTGAYAHPSFAPDGRSVTARYAPDPANPLQKTQLVSISILEKTRTVLVEGATTFPSDEDVLKVVDYPAWFDAGVLLFAVAEYSGGNAPRLTSSGIWRFTAGTRRVTHLAGGESYYDAKGRSIGFKATMPHREGPHVAFVAIRGSSDRRPMVSSQTGQQATAGAIRDPEFVGPCLAVGKQFLYVIEEATGTWRLALKGAGEKTRRVIPFSGDASEPAVIPDRAFEGGPLSQLLDRASKGTLDTRNTRCDLCAT